MAALCKVNSLTYKLYFKYLCRKLNEQCVCYLPIETQLNQNEVFLLKTNCTNRTIYPKFCHNVAGVFLSYHP